MKSTHISIRFPPELLAKIRWLAAAEQRTVSNLIVKTMQIAVNNSVGQQTEKG